MTQRGLSGSEPWGYKATIVVYVQGGEELLEAAIDAAAAELDGLPGVEFVGALSEPVQDEPKDQVAS